MIQVAFETYKLSPVNLIPLIPPILPIPPTRRAPPWYEDFDPDRRYQDEELPTRKKRDKKHKKQENQQRIS